jgi:hypothetical protein
MSRIGTIGLILLALQTTEISDPVRGVSSLDVDICALNARPLDYENRRVRVSGEAVSGSESVALSNETCSAYIWLDESTEKYEKFYRGWSLGQFAVAASRGQLKGEGPAVDWRVPLPVISPDKDQLAILGKGLRKTNGGPVRAIITGRFDFAGNGLLTYSRERGYEFVPAFGHLNCCKSRIVIERVELVED